jgi:hypothetical protein
MPCTLRRLVLFATVFAALGAAQAPAAAQTSPSFRLTESTLNAGGHPRAGQVLQSLSFRVSLDSLGEGIVGRGLAGGGFRLDASFLAAYPPPGEVGGLHLPDPATATWNHEPSAGTYNLYRDPLSALSGANAGSCFQSALAATSATLPDTPPSGGGFFYLVTVRNRLSEEGTLGSASGGAERTSPAPCP